MKMDKITDEMNELRVRLEEIKVTGGDGELVSVNKYVKDRIDRHKEIMYNDGYVSKIEIPSDRLVEHLEESLLLEIEELKQKLEILENTSSPKQANANIMKDRSLAYEGTYTMYASRYVKEKVVEFLEKEKLQFITLELEGYGEMSFPTLRISIKGPYWKYYDNMFKESMSSIGLCTHRTNEIYIDNLVEMRKDDYQDSKLELEKLFIELKNTEEEIDNFPKRRFFPANRMVDLNESYTHEIHKLLKSNISFEAERMEKTYERMQERVIDEDILIKEELTKALNFAKDTLEYPIKIM